MRQFFGKIFYLLLIAFVFADVFVVAKNFDFEKGLVLGEESVSDSPGNTFSSENYQIKQLNVGDDVAMDLGSEDRTVLLVISEVKSDVYSLKNKDETSMVLDWKTNKTGSCNVSYYKKGENASKVSKESDFVLSHTMVLSGLEADSVYGYRIKCFDRWGSEENSDEYVFYTGAPNISFMDILSNAAGKLFGWAIRK